MQLPTAPLAAPASAPATGAGAAQVHARALFYNVSPCLAMVLHQGRVIMLSSSSPSHTGMLSLFYNVSPCLAMVLHQGRVIMLSSSSPSHTGMLSLSIIHHQPANQHQPSIDRR
jgi:hypothetical protein